MPIALRLAAIVLEVVVGDRVLRRCTPKEVPEILRRG
jgi:hypothetical protein